MSTLNREKDLFFYNSANFPFRDYIDMRAVHQHAHFVFTAAELRVGFESLGDVQQSNNQANAKITMLCFAAKALHLGLHYRGAHVGKSSINGQPRVTVLLNYLTQTLFQNEVRREIVPPEELYLSSNIVGVAVHMFIHDPDLRWSDILSDTMMVNRYGAPVPKPKEQDRFARQPNEQHGLERQEQPAPLEFVGRPDRPGEHLNHPDCAYVYLTQLRVRRGKSKKTARAGAASSRQHGKTSNGYRTLDRLYKYAQLGGVATGSTRFYNVPGGDSIQHLDTLGEAHPLQFSNLFSWEKAFDTISKMKIDPLFLDRSNWFNTRRVPDVETFGSPYWQAGGLEPELGGGFRGGYAAGQTDTCAELPLAMFRPSSIYRTLLPHVALFRSAPTLDEHGNRIVDPGYVMEALGLPSAARLIELETESSMNKDVFNALNDEGTAGETRVKQLLKTPLQPEADYKRELRKLREAGYRAYASLMGDISNPSLPEGYKFLLLWRHRNPKIVPKEEPLWQAPDVGLTAYAQFKVQQLCVSEMIMQSSDSQLFLLPVLLRAALTVYIGRYGGKLYREHIQVVCAPGTGKSDLINKLTNLLIPNTYEIQGGASSMGLIGKHQSQRIIELSHELDSHYAPTREPEMGEAMKIHKMLLGCLSEGFKKYKTTESVIDPVTGVESREPVVRVSEDTNVRMGNRNYDEFYAKPGGSAAAMRDRFTTLLMTMLYSARRPSLLGSVLNIQYAACSEAAIEVQHQYHLVQDLFARYHAGMSAGWLPKADFQLYNKLSPLMTAFIATRYPNFLSALRSVSTMNARIITESGMHAAWLTLFTPLNPTAKVELIKDTELACLREKAVAAGQDPELVRPYVVKMDVYDPDVLLQRMAHLYYCRYEQLVFVITEKLFEMTNVVSLEVTRHIAERNSRYFTYGRGAAEQALEYEGNPWPVDTPNQQRNSKDRPKQFPLQRFFEEYTDQQAAGKPDGFQPFTGVYYLGIPATMRQTSARRADAGSGMDTSYNSFELIPETIPPEHLALYQTMARSEGRPSIVERPEVPLYKMESCNGGHKFFNANYVCVPTSIQDYARSASGIFGHYKIDQDGLVQMLRGLTKEYMVTPYLPLVRVHDPALNIPNWEECLSRVQSLRYLPNFFCRFPKFRVPVLIEHEAKNCFYMLVSYFETNPYKICREMINFISYKSTPSRRMVFGVPAESNHFIYEPYEMRPRAGVELKIPGRGLPQEVSKKMVSKYLFNSQTGTSMVGNRNAFEGLSFLDDCMEQHFAVDYLLRNFPDEDRATLLGTYAPSAIDAQLTKFYTDHPQCLERRPYPACVNPPEPVLPPAEKGAPPPPPEKEPAQNSNPEPAASPAPTLRVASSGPRAPTVSEQLVLQRTQSARLNREIRNNPNSSEVVALAQAYKAAWTPSFQLQTGDDDEDGAGEFDDEEESEQQQQAATTVFEQRPAVRRVGGRRSPEISRGSAPLGDF